MMFHVKHGVFRHFPFGRVRRASDARPYTPTQTQQVVSRETIKTSSRKTTHKFFVKTLK